MNKDVRRILIATVTVFCLSSAIPSSATVPDGINYQGYLTNADGSPVDTDVSITFAAYNVDVGGVPLWNTTQLIAVDQGLFSITLGSPVNPFPMGLFDDPVYIGLFVAGEQMLPRRMITTSAYSFKAADADRLNGVTATSLDQSAEVTTLQSTVSTIDARISDIESIGADITGVTIGSGLVGGGEMGDVILSVAPGGIDVTHLAMSSVSSAVIIDGDVSSDDIAPGGVTTANIADGAVGPAKIDATAAYTLGGATINGATTIFDAPFAVKGGFDVEFWDSFHTQRWYTTDGSAQMASIEVSPVSVSFRDNNPTSNRYVFNSTSTGIGIGMFAPVVASGHAVTMPSLRVTGQTDVGVVRVSTTATLGGFVNGCAPYSDSPCYFDSLTAQCPVGTKVLGGGAKGTAAGWGVLRDAYPITDSAFRCYSMSLSANTQTCYAICARLE